MNKNRDVEKNFMCSLPGFRASCWYFGWCLL